MTDQDQTQPVQPRVTSVQPTRSVESTAEQRTEKFLKRTSKPRWPKYLLILLGLTILVSTGGGAYYFFYLKQKRTPPLEREEAVERPTTHFLTDGEEGLSPPKNTSLLGEGVEIGHGGTGYRIATDTYYSKSDSGELVLLSVQGLVDEIDYKERFFYLASEGVRRKLNFSVKEIPIYLVEYHPPEDYSGSGSYVPMRKETPGSFEDISVGDIVTYNIPNEFSHIERFLVQKNEN